MSDATAEAMMTIKAEPADAGPRALRGALLCGMLAVAVVIADVWWVGLRAAVDLNSRAFNPLPLFVVVCAAVLGTTALISGVVHTLRHHKFGGSELTVSEPRLGGHLKGLVRTTRDLAAPAGFRARLRCDLHTSMTNSRGGRTSGTTCLWESVRAVPATTNSSTGIPIEIAIPANGLASGVRKKRSGTDERVTWALEIAAPLRGLDYYAEFAVPMNAGPSRTAGESASVPFAGGEAPRSTRWKWLLRGLAMFGALVAVAGAFGIADELRSTRVVGHVTAYRSGTLDVAIDGSGQPPVTAHVTRLPVRTQRERGAAVALICGEVKDGTYSCDPDAGLRWWIQTGVAMSVGLGMLLTAFALWRRRRWWA